MLFRGTKTVRDSQLADISVLMGGNNDADTQGAMTQFFFSVPAQNLDVALRLEAARARGLAISQKDWNIERGAIMNEVTQDDSIAIAKLFQRTILPSIFAGTPYAHDTLGTLNSFKRQINAPQLRAFYNIWYHPNNAVYVIAGDVDGPSTVKMVARYFDAVPAAKLPSRPAVVLRPVKRATYHVDSDQPYSILAVAYRMPGFSSPDYAAGQILTAVLNNHFIHDSNSLSTNFFGRRMRIKHRCVTGTDDADTIVNNSFGAVGCRRNGAKHTKRCVFNKG